jgi:hypothetical protein
MRGRRRITFVKRWKVQTVFVLRCTTDSLDGYVFANEAEGRKWMKQPLIRKADGYELVSAVATRSRGKCICCGAVHWTMRWRGKQRIVSGSWKAPS